MERPKDIGILAIEVYFPYTYVKQEELEKFDGAPAGKYTVGLGQTNMAFCSDREDINSICMTAVQNLLEKNNIPIKSIGRLEVGTETIIDKSKSVKSTLMALFAQSGNTNLEGVDTINACYGGTSALLNAVQWVSSEYWDGRYALVVCGDIAVYAAGAARPTGGCGTVAMLIGPNAKLLFEPIRGTYMEHAYDFYKPNLSSEYPVVDGRLSITCYLRALDNCQENYTTDFERKKKEKFSVSNADYVVFHSPYNKLVQKSFARLIYNDTKRQTNQPNLEWNEGAAWKSCIDKYKKMVVPSIQLPVNIGNSYCASLYMGLVSLLTEIPDATLVGKRIVLFSYGSGLASTMFSLVVKSSIQPLVKQLDYKNRLSARRKTTPDEFSKTLKLREERGEAAGYKPTGSLDDLYAGTYYLVEIDDKHRRTYARKQKAAL